MHTPQGDSVHVAARRPRTRTARACRRPANGANNVALISTSLLFEATPPTTAILFSCPSFSCRNQSGRHAPWPSSRVAAGRIISLSQAAQLSLARRPVVAGRDNLSRPLRWGRRPAIVAVLMDTRRVARTETAHAGELDHANKVVWCARASQRRETREKSHRREFS